MFIILSDQTRQGKDNIENPVFYIILYLFY